MKTYFIEFGPDHNRVFVKKPSNPLGKVVEITEDQLKSLQSVHQKMWKLKSGRVVAGRTISLTVRARLILVLLIGLSVGLTLGLML